MKITKTSIEIPKWHKGQEVFGFQIIRMDIKENGVYEINDRDVFKNSVEDWTDSYGVIVNYKSIKVINLLLSEEGVKFKHYTAKHKYSPSTIDKIELSNDAWYKLTNFGNLTTLFLYIDEEGESYIHRVNLHDNW